MVKSKCIKCGKQAFDVEDYVVPKQAPLKLVRCASCGSVVGVFQDAREVANRVEKRMGELEKIVQKATEKAVDDRLGGFHVKFGREFGMFVQDWFRNLTDTIAEIAKNVRPG